MFKKLTRQKRRLTIRQIGVYSMHRVDLAACRSVFFFSCIVCDRVVTSVKLLRTIRKRAIKHQYRRSVNGFEIRLVCEKHERWRDLTVSAENERSFIVASQWRCLKWIIIDQYWKLTKSFPGGASGSKSSICANFRLFDNVFVIALRDGSAKSAVVLSPG